MLDAHLPFRDFELARPTPEGGKRYISVSGLPVFDEDWTLHRIPRGGAAHHGAQDEQKRRSGAAKPIWPERRS